MAKFLQGLGLGAELRFPAARFCDARVHGFLVFAG
jgi:hypothetical protein